jgi:DNA-binding NarL/FixJ family response regulator
MKEEPGASPITVAIVEDDAEIREMLSRVVRRSPQLKFLGNFPSGEAALSELPKLDPQVVIMDIRLPGMSGIDCTRLLKKSMPGTQVLVFTVFGDSEQVFRALEAGASGFLLKRTGRREIVEAIEQVRGGGAPMSGEIARKVVESFRQAPPSPASSRDSLTPREEEVLGLLAKGYATKEIADLLSVATETVRFHLKHIYEKLHVRSRTEALLKYLK